MKKISSLLIVFMALWTPTLSWSAASSQSEKGEGSFQEYVESRNKLFVVETDEESARSSLDRISGDIDRGYASEEYTYKSRNHGLNGPLEHEKEETLYY